jgi:HPt (histidine-containing phosphotransfer) domain-containing protein
MLLRRKKDKYKQLIFTKRYDIDIPGVKEDTALSIVLGKDNEFYVVLDEIERAIESGESRVSISPALESEVIDEKNEKPVEAEVPKMEEKEAVAAAEMPQVAKTEKIEGEPARTQSPAKEKKEAISSRLTAEDILRDIKPIPIEFSLHIASEELSLPEDLVLEFINDFAQQAHENLPILIEEYRNDELDKLQKTAHMLKGAASNLRVEQMVNNLYELQYDNNIENAPQRIRLFAGQLMGLDNYLQQMNAK